jgi:hypothetical protein
VPEVGEEVSEVGEEEVCEEEVGEEEVGEEEACEQVVFANGRVFTQSENV